jgi:RNA polymerase sigma factor (sigma-70 family)
MQGPTASRTSLSLLKKLALRPADEAAWEEFVGRYGAKILGWCRAWRLQDADAADVTQVVLVKMIRNIDKFDKQVGSFRAWLKTIAHHAWYDLVTSRSHRVKRGGDTLARTIESEAARDDLARHLEAAWDQELFQLSSERVQLRVRPQTWRAFERTAIEGVPGDQVAEELGMNLPAVYKARSNVTKLLQEEVVLLQKTEFE